MKKTYAILFSLIALATVGQVNIVTTAPATKLDKKFPNEGDTT